MRTYNPAALYPHDPTSLAWALNWARRFAGDVPAGDGAWPPASLEDEEWQAWLGATATTVSGVVYYRPHEAAANAIVSNPHWARRLSLMGLSQEFRTAEEAAGAIRWAGAWVDQLIAQATGGASTQGNQLWPSF